MDPLNDSTGDIDFRLKRSQSFTEELNDSCDDIWDDISSGDDQLDWNYDPPHSFFGQINFHDHPLLQPVDVVIPPPTNLPVPIDTSQFVQRPRPAVIHQASMQEDELVSPFEVVPQQDEDESEGSSVEEEIFEDDDAEDEDYKLHKKGPKVSVDAKRKRGRPKKNVAQLYDRGPKLKSTSTNTKKKTLGDKNFTPTAQPKKRGRPRLTAPPQPEATMSAQSKNTTKAKPGPKPKKTALPSSAKPHPNLSAPPAGTSSSRSAKGSGMTSPFVPKIPLLNGASNEFGDHSKNIHANPNLSRFQQPSSGKIVPIGNGAKPPKLSKALSPRPVLQSPMAQKLKRVAAPPNLLNISQEVDILGTSPQRAGSTRVTPSGTQPTSIADSLLPVDELLSEKPTKTTKTTKTTTTTTTTTKRIKIETSLGFAQALGLEDDPETNFVSPHSGKQLAKFVFRDYFSEGQQAPVQMRLLEEIQAFPFV